MRMKVKVRSACALAKARLAGVRTPLSVYLSVTDRCVFRCAYCNIPNRKNTDPPLGTLVEMIRGAARAGAVRLQFVGGEPLLRPDIGELIRAAKAEGLFVTMSSMGWPVPERLSDLRSADRIFLSFDGDREIHDSHKGKGTFDRLMESMDLLRQNGIGFSTTTLVTRRSAPALDFILAVAREKGFQAVFQPLYSTGEAIPGHFHLDRVEDRLLLSPEENRAFFRKVLKVKRAGAPVASSARYLEILSGHPDFSRVYSPDRHPAYTCWAGKLYCYLDTDGLLYPCGDSIGRSPGADAFRLGFPAAFKSLQMNGACQSCIVACDLEQNLMFSLDAGTLVNWIRKTA